MLAFVIEEKLATLVDQSGTSLYETVEKLRTAHKDQYNVRRIELRNDGCPSSMYKEIVERFDSDIQKLQDEGVQFTLHAARAIPAQDNVDQAILGVLEKDISLAQQLRIPLIVTHASFSVRSRDRKNYYSIMHLLPKLAQKGEEAGVKIAIENISLKNDKIQQTNDNLYILEQVRKIESEWLGITIDIGHAISCGYDEEYLTNVIAVAKDKLFHIHSHETTYGADEHLPLCGAIEWPLIFSSLETVDFKGAFLLEVKSSNIAKSLQYLKSIDFTC